MKKVQVNQINYELNNLTDAEKEQFYIRLGEDAFKHFMTLDFENYPQSDFYRVAEHLLKEVKTKSNKMWNDERW